MVVACNFTVLNSLSDKTWLDRIALLSIALNSAALALTSPMDTTNVSLEVKIAYAVEIVCACLWTVEALIKAMSMGVCGERSFLRDPWNRLDFAILLSGYAIEPSLPRVCDFAAQLS